jgi:hypothetical protein
MNKERKIYVAIGGLALAILGADRLFFAAATSPDSASAGLIVPASAASAPGSPARGAPPAIDLEAASLALRTDQSLPYRLESFSRANAYDLSAVGDAFLPSEAWQARVKPTPSPADKSAVQPLDRRIEQFIAGHKLTAVMLNADGGIAMVDGQPLRPGQTLDGFKLVAVHSGQAEFEIEGRTARMSLANGQGGLLKSRSAR